MVGEALRRMFSALVAPRPASAERISVTEQPAAIYAVGDIHGCLDLLLELEAQIAADAAGISGERWLLSLGDAVDRGPSSAQVIDHLLTPGPAGLRRINLMGNHESMMLDFLRNPRAEAIWLENGGRAALQSYGVPLDRLLQLDDDTARSIATAHIPAEHVDHLLSLPVLADTPAAIFVHAGLRPGATLDRQRDDDLIWYRDEYRDDFAEFGRPVVHGHTPRETPLVTPHRIAVDTGAVLSGVLTAVRITPDGPPRLFSTPPRPMPQAAAFRWPPGAVS